MVGFIGDNTHATLQKKFLTKFQKGYKEFSKTKKRNLAESIKLAKDMIENKGKGDDLEKLKSDKNFSKEPTMKGKNKLTNCKSITNYTAKPQSDSESESEDKTKEIPKKKVLKKKTAANTSINSSGGNNSFLKRKKRRQDDQKESTDLLTFRQWTE